MPGIKGKDYFVGDHEDMTIQDCRERAEAFRTGRVPDSDDIRHAQMVIRDGKYAWYEEELAKAVMAAAQSHGMLRPR